MLLPDYSELHVYDEFDAFRQNYICTWEVNRQQWKGLERSGTSLMYSLHWSIVTMEIKRPLCLFSGKRFYTLWANKFEGIRFDKVRQSPTSLSESEWVLYHSKECKFHQVIFIFWDN